MTELKNLAHFIVEEIFAYKFYTKEHLANSILVAIIKFNKRIEEAEKHKENP